VCTEKVKEGHTCASRALVTALHTSRRYFSRYFGKRVAKDDSSVNAPALLSVVRKGSIFHYRELIFDVRMEVI
jgi:hypothetical protein